MHKKLIIIIYIIFCFSILTNFNKVEAFSLENEVSYRLDEESDCKAILGDPKDKESFAYMLQQIFTIIGYIAPVLCLVLSTIDFVKAAASQDKDGLKKAFKTASKRVILTMVLFFLPMLINFTFNLLGWYGTCGIE